MTTMGLADVTINTCTCFVVLVGETILFRQNIIRQIQLLSINEANIMDVNAIGITVDPQVASVALPPRRHAFSLQNENATELERLQQANVIEPVKQATSWLSPLVPVLKANGTIHLCVGIGGSIKQSYGSEYDDYDLLFLLPAVCNGF